jgi:uncharacterized protein
VATVGETDLAELLWNMQPVLHESPFVFCTLKPGEDNAAVAAAAWCRADEAEGITCILPEATARTHALQYQDAWARITLGVHSSLSAVGFLSMVSTSLAMENIGVNVISAFYHDHLFVHWDERLRAMQVLQKLSGRTRAGMA